ncbi:hypothetical protein LCGC14_0452680 [marine sediment metagenome]|uniref:Uncharacterized protein n=1 Tax=marine sediment metagenome TaxID=412755 RepID=A0A0F9V490_9ZZZZ
MSVLRSITEIQFQPWEPHNIIPGMKRGWPEHIRHVVATHVERPPALEGTLSDPLWHGVHYIEPQAPFHHDSSFVSTKVYLAWDAAALYVGIRAALPALPDAVETGSDAEHDRLGEERVALAIDVRHNHCEMQTISINARGELEWYDDASQMAGFSDEAGFQYYWWSLNDMNPDPSARAREMGLRGAAVVGDREWTAEMAIPLASLNVETPFPGQTMGLEIIRTATELPAESFNYHFTWMPQYPGVLCSPIKMGAMSFGPAPVSLEAIDFPNCSWGINNASVRLRNNSQRTIRAEMISRGVCGSEPGNTHTNPPVESGPVEIPAQTSISTTFEYHMPVRFMPETIELELRDHAQGDRLLRVSYNLGTCAVVYPFGQEAGMTTPHLDDPDFVEKRHRYIVSRQPLLRRRTTRQGAPSDFTIEAVDGSIEFDLMQDGVMQTIADWLCSLYDSDIDRVIGSTFFMAQQAVYVYASRRAHFAALLDPLSNLRLGGGMCGEFARSHVGVLSRMTSVGTGNRFHARKVNLGGGGHALTTVRMFDRWVLLDPTPPNVKAFFHRDHQTLASGQDLQLDPTLIAYNGSTLTKPPGPLVQSVACGTTWPDGAPAE